MPHGGSYQPNRRLGKMKRAAKIGARKSLGTALLIASVAAPATQVSAQEPSPGYSESFESLAGRCAPSVHLRTLSAVVMQESKGYQFAIGINGKSQLPRQPRNEAEAIATVRWLLQNGYNFDAGLGQINSNNFTALGLTPDILFEPCTNLKAAAVILTQCYAKSVKSYGGQAAIHGALSCYNTGNLRRGFANGYVRKVVGQVSLPVPALSSGTVPRAAPPARQRDPVEIASIDRGHITGPRGASEAAQPSANDGMRDAFSRGPRDAFAPPPAPENLPESDTGPVRLTASVESF